MLQRNREGEICLKLNGAAIEVRGWVCPCGSAVVRNKVAVNSRCHFGTAIAFWKTYERLFQRFHLVLLFKSRKTDIASTIFWKSARRMMKGTRVTHFIICIKTFEGYFRSIIPITGPILSVTCKFSMLNLITDHVSPHAISP